jgi:hydrogenase maturation protein HypF
MGAQAKSTFALQMDERCYVSPFLGNLDSYDTQQNYHLTMDHLCGLLHMVPDRILCDAHPDYASTHVAQQMAHELQLPLESVPHHLAHFSAVLAEHGLWSAPDSVLGVIWDGAGMGTDGQIWGGEFFGYANFHFERIGHIGYFDVLAGDKMAREPRLAAFALCHQLPEAQSLLRSMFAEPEWKVYTQWSRRKSPVQTSSVGRLFDATAALLGVSHKQTWEGSAATLLEELAINYCKNHPMEQLHAYPIATDPDGNIATAPLFSAIIHDILQGESPARIAANFHVSLAVLVQQFARQQPFRRIAFSGGVFQNGLLCDLLRERLEADYQLYFHHQLPPNDENIAFGQLVYHHISNNRQAFLNLKSPKYVLSNSR